MGIRSDRSIQLISGGIGEGDLRIMAKNWSTQRAEYCTYVYEALSVA